MPQAMSKQGMEALGHLKEHAPYRYIAAFTHSLFLDCCYCFKLTYINDAVHACHIVTTRLGSYKDACWHTFGFYLCN